jgi:hypothetical protein
VRLTAKPPPKGSPRIERMYYLRRNYGYNVLYVMPLLIVAIAFGSTFLLIAVLACYSLLAAGFSVLSLQIRRERRRSP